MIGKTARDTAYRVSLNIGHLHPKYRMAHSDDILDEFDSYIVSKYKIGNLFMTSEGIQKSLFDDSYIKDCSVHPGNFSVVFRRLEKDFKASMSKALERDSVRNFTLSSLSDRDVEKILEGLLLKWQD